MQIRAANGAREDLELDFAASRFRGRGLAKGERFADLI